MKLITTNIIQQLKHHYPINMDHKRLYEIKIEQLEKEKKNLKVENENLMLEILELRDDVYDWKQKFKELKKSITNK